MKVTVDWFGGLTDSIFNWLLSIRDERHLGYFYYCQSGRKLMPSPKTGLGFSSMALKITYQIGGLGRLNESELKQWTSHICSFQRWPWGRLTGWFEDKAMMRALGRWGGRNGYSLQVRRAETRQACAALLGVGAQPRWPIRAIPRTKRQVIKYIDSLSWHLPWGAASHFAHLVFFLKLNAELFGQGQAQHELIPKILAMVDKLQDKETGTWFKGNPSSEQMINGAMKMLTAYDVLGKAFAYPEKLIDFCLNVSNDQDACHNVDILYVLYQCSQWTNHRRQDIEDFAARRIDIIYTHYKPDGAFSFFPEHTGTHYYGVEVSEPRVESDVHGTHLLVWGLTIIGELLGFNEDLGWQMPIT